MLWLLAEFQILIIFWIWIQLFNLIRVVDLFNFWLDPEPDMDLLI